MLIYQLCISFSLIVFFAILLKNFIDLKSLPKASPANYPKVSVMVPARNEEANIAACIMSLLDQNYPNYEVLVLNDHSEDKTPKILNELQLQYPQLKILTGKDLPEDWLGKCWACHQLSQEASGDLLLFTDADTRHKLHSITRSVSALQQNQADMLTLIPYQELGSFWERVIVPLIHFSVLCYLPIKFIWRRKSSAFVFANGQFMLFTRKMYETINGHESVKNALVEDVWLCKAVKRAGGKPMVFRAIDEMSCRMYRNFKDTYEGFSKNLFPGLGSNLAAITVISALSFLFYIAPFGFLLQAIIDGEFTLASLYLPLSHVLIGILLRLIIALWFKLSLFESVLHVLSMSMFILIAMNSVRWIKFGKGALWKGRRYKFT